MSSQFTQRILTAGWTLLFALSISIVTATTHSEGESDHWAFRAPVRTAPPQVAATDWPRSHIDHFVAARLEIAGLRPAEEAPRRTLIRRVTLDLTGLPPEIDEVHAFLADQSPDAYEKVVERLLASPAYGEHMARYWLDVARYGDTHGLHLDNYREMWPYRDWVIRAFNENLPYDQFLTEQLAGDLLPEPSLDQLVATGFNRCHVSTNEGGSIDEEVYVRNVVDRVSTTGTAMLGLTVGCAVCHDHKYDPISQKEFYQLFAYFNSLDGPSMDGNVKDPAPSIRVPTAEQAEQLAALNEQVERLSATREDILRTSSTSFEAWADTRLTRAQREQEDEELDVSEGLFAHFPLDREEGDAVASALEHQDDGRLVGKPERTTGRLGRAVRFGQGAYVDLGNVGDFDKDSPFSFGAWVRTTGKFAAPALSKTISREGLRGYELFVDHGKVSVLLSARWPGYAIKVTSADDVLERGNWHHVFVTYDGSQRAAGVTLYVDGRPRAVHVNADSLHHKGSIDTGAPLLLGRRDDATELISGAVDDVRLYDRSLTDADVLALYLGSQLAYDLRQASDSDAHKEMLQRFYLIRNDPQFAQISRQLDEHRATIDGIEAQVPTTLIFRARDKPRDAFVLLRGEYDQPGDQVARSLPAFLPPLESQLPNNRLGLARWLVGPNHPLTGRVAVNRFWQQVFGVGLVKTAEDFGTQGSAPSHPQLLDWLAVEFRERDWDVKWLMKELVMSATYRQSSHLTPDSSQRDPENRLLARGPRFRLDAEVLRDQALAISGLLVRKIGGPSVKPPQPQGLWYAVGYSGSNTVRFVADEGPDKVHRRSLYTFWKRTSPPPQMSTFDAPSRETCLVRRERTNTPLQALLLMNDPQFVEAARHFAERALMEGPGDVLARLDWMFERATARLPQVDVREELLAAHADFAAQYAKNRQAAVALLAAGHSPPDAALDPVELASWTLVANAIMNLDQFVTKE